MASIEPTPPPEAQTEAEKTAYCAGWWAAMEAKRSEPGRAQRMRDAGYARRPTLREMAEPGDPTYKLIGCVQHDCEECQRRTRRPAEPVGVVTSMVKGGVTWQRWPADMPDGTLLFSEVQP